MKRIIVILTVMLSANFMSAQGLFDKLEDLDAVDAVVVTKDAFELLQKFPDAKSEDMEVFNMLKGLQELKVFSTEDAGVSSKMEGMVTKAIGSAKLTELMRVKDQGTKAKIYVKSTSNKDVVSEVLMFVKDTSNKSTIISLLGDIDINKLSKIASKYEKKS